jgi:hypothetical protein
MSSSGQIFWPICCMIKQHTLRFTYTTPKKERKKGKKRKKKKQEKKSEEIEGRKNKNK